MDSTHGGHSAACPSVIRGRPAGLRREERSTAARSSGVSGPHCGKELEYFDRAAESRNDAVPTVAASQPRALDRSGPHARGGTTICRGRGGNTVSPDAHAIAANSRLAAVPQSVGRRGARRAQRRQNRGRRSGRGRCHVAEDHRRTWPRGPANRLHAQSGTGSVASGRHRRTPSAHRIAVGVVERDGMEQMIDVPTLGPYARGCSDCGICGRSRHRNR